MSIPLPRLLREHRHQQHLQRRDSQRSRWALAVWAFVAARPRWYRPVMSLGTWLLRRLSGGRGSLRKAPLAGAWTLTRDLPAPAGSTFMSQWRRRRRS